MTGFILRKLGYSLLVLLGVMLLTFVLFQMAAGDPAAAVLGKNPAPAEIEAMRRELKSDLPLFWGHWRTSELFSPVLHVGRENALPGVQFPQFHAFEGNYPLLGPGAQAVWTRRFPVPEPVLVRITGRGAWRINAMAVPQTGRDTYELELAEAPEKLILTAEGAPGRLESVTFFRKQSSPWHSQFFGTLTELCAVKREFPYLTFFNFGKTLTTREPINQILLRGVGPSLAVMLPIFLGELVLGIALAMLATACKDSWFDRLLLLVSVAGMSVSYLVLIIAGQWFLGYYCNLFPVWGWGDWRYLALPVIIGIASGLGGGVRFYRTVFVNELQGEYLRTAAAKGCAPWVVFNKHLLRNALIPIIARASAQLPFIFTGSLLLESFFGIPGLGYASIDALNNSDLALLKALTVVNALLFVVINLLADLACAWADPRIRITR